MRFGRIVALVILSGSLMVASSFRQSLNACNRGDAVACEEVGVRYITGNGVRLNGYKAIQYLSKACKHSVAGACNTMAFIYANGEGGVKQDYKKALYYWRKACRYGDRSACANIDLAKDKLKHNY
jgi:TPR repeat protein